MFVTAILVCCIFGYATSERISPHFDRLMQDEYYFVPNGMYSIMIWVFVHMEMGCIVSNLHEQNYCNPKELLTILRNFLTNLDLQPHT